MLSGIGCPDQLAAHGVEVIEPLPGVGKNLQDRYEVSVVNRMTAPWSTMRKARYDHTDRYYRKWRFFKRSLYTSNGACCLWSCLLIVIGGSPTFFVLLSWRSFLGISPVTRIT
jgi:hypothetical protein